MTNLAQAWAEYRRLRFGVQTWEGRKACDDLRDAIFTYASVNRRQEGQ